VLADIVDGTGTPDECREVGVDVPGVVAEEDAVVG
jgi:hypothetical protein